MIVHFYDIVWDTGEENEGGLPDLPTDCYLQVDDGWDIADIEEGGADLLSVHYGWCVESFEFGIDRGGRVMKTLRIEGSHYGISRCPQPQGTPLEVAKELATSVIGDVADDTMMFLIESQIEEYVPPRCRKPRTRIVEAKIGEWAWKELKPLEKNPSEVSILTPC